MTTLAPPTVPVGQTATVTAGRSGPVAWMALPALAMFVGFGVIPLIGVLALSFTTWDGIGTIQATDPDFPPGPLRPPRAGTVVVACAATGASAVTAR